MTEPNYHYPEQITINQQTIACDGSGSGHPRVYLKINPQTKMTECPYCDKVFIFNGDADSDNHH